MGRTTVQDVMTRDVVAVNAETPYREIVTVLAEGRVSAVPVLDRAGRVIGVVSEADLLDKIKFQGQQELAVPDWVSGQCRSGWVKGAGTIAAGLMTSPAITIRPDATVVTAAKVMEAEDVKRLPVLNEAGDLVGIVARRDLLRVFLRADDELRRDVETTVAGQVGQDAETPGEIQVNVGCGVVTLTGSVRRRSQVRAAERLAWTVDGVVHVMCRLNYDEDDTGTAGAPPSTRPRSEVGSPR